MSMRVKKGVLVVFFAFCFLSISLAFADDFQSYNAVTDVSFTSNYTMYNAYFNIIQAPTDSLTLSLYEGNLDNLIIINESKLNLTYPFNWAITLRKNSWALSGNYPKIAFSFFTNASNNIDISGSHGYSIIYDLNSSILDLRRCSVYIENRICGVSLNTSIMNSSSIGFQINSEKTNLTADLVFILSMDNSKRFHFYANNIEYMNYYDTTETYLSGGIIFGQHSNNAYNHNYYWDNINSNATMGGGTTTGWKTYSFPTNRANWIGIGSPASSNFIVQYALDGTSFAADFYSTYLYDGGYPINRHLMPYFVMTRNNAYFSQTIWNLDPVRVEAIISAPHINTCYYNINSTDIIDMATSSLYTSLGAVDTYIYDPSIIGLGNQSYLPTNPWIVSFITSAYQNATNNPYFYCVSPENLTFQVRITNGSYNGLEFIQDYDLPIGYTFYPNGTIDYGTTIEANDSSIIIRRQSLACILGDTRPECLVSQANQLDVILAALFSYTMIGLYLSIIIASLVAYYTRNGIFGAIIMIICLMVMASVGLLGTWFMYFIIVVAALGLAIMILTKK